jgi:DNA-binding MarR family transcriptional regulator
MDSSRFSKAIQEWAETFMHHSFRDFKRFMDEASLSQGQVHAMMNLYHCESCNISDIGEHLGVSNAAASQMIDKLVGAGLLERAEGASDRRTKDIRLSPKGYQLVEAGIQSRCLWMDALTQVLTPEQQEQVALTLPILTEAVRKLDALQALTPEL